MSTDRPQQTPTGVNPAARAARTSFASSPPYIHLEGGIPSPFEANIGVPGRVSLFSHRGRQRQQASESHDGQAAFPHTDEELSSQRQAAPSEQFVRESVAFLAEDLFDRMQRIPPSIVGVSSTTLVRS